MTKEQAFFLELMKLTVKGEQLLSLPGESLNWKEIWKEACGQAVRIIFCDTLGPVQEELTSQFPELEHCMTEAFSLLGKNIRVETSQRELVEVLDQVACPYVILKGLSAAAYYPDPSQRQLGDVDFMVPEQYMPEIAEKMQKKGYTCDWTEHNYHHELHKGDLEIEMHIEIAGMPSGPDRKIVEEYMSSIYDKSQVCENGSDHFRMPGDGHHAVVLLLHMQHHVEGYGFGLRHLMDWACFVNKTADRDFWPELLEMLKKVGLYRFTAVMTRICAMYLGSACPDWALDADEELCRDMMGDIMSGGNFGRNDKSRKSTAFMLPDWESNKKEGKVKRMYAVLRQSILKQKPELEHKPFRMGCMLVYKTFRFAVLFLQGKRPNLLKAATVANERISVYERLGMYQKDSKEA